MSHISVSALRLRFLAVILSTLVAVLGFASGAAAALYDFQPANGNYNVAANWLDYTTSTSAVPGELDGALVRNGGTLNLTAADGNTNAYVIRIGAGPQTDTGAIEGFDPPTPTYGGAGTLNWTGGDILGNTTNSVGPRLTVGQRDTATNTNFTGIVNHSGGKINLNTNSSFLIVGASGSTPTPTSVYNLLPGGTIGVNAGAGSNDGINVRNGTFNMTGGNINSDNSTFDQRAITVATGSGGTAGNETVATANFSGGTVYVNGGMRVATQSNTKGYVTISGTANVHFRGADVSLGRSATNSYAQVDMSAGSLSVGDVVEGQERRLIIGDTGTGVFNLSGGTVDLNNSFVVGNTFSSKGTFYQTGGSLTVRSIETNRNTGAYDLLTENATIIIDGPSAVFTQQNLTPFITGQTTIGNFGRGRFEVRQGQANLREIRVSQNPGSRATLNVTGGILRVQDGLNRTNVDAATIPTINLTGGELELTPALPATAFQWQASMNLLGTDFDPRPGGLLQTNIGNSTRPGDFGLNTGSVWDLDIASNTLIGGADWVDVNNGTAALNGGLLNIHHIGGYTPAVGDTVTILRNLVGGVTLNSGAVTVSDPNWVLQTNGTNTAIELTYVPAPDADYNDNGIVDAADYVLWRKTPGSFGGDPGGYNNWKQNFGEPSPGSGGGGAVPEPTTIVLVGLFASAALVSRRARCGKRYGASCR